LNVEKPNSMLDRRKFCRTVAAAPLWASQVRAQTPTSARPNIIFILADDLGYGDLGAYGQTRFKTPNLDRLAAAGMRFTQAYAGSTVCAPSRCALMVGQHTGHCRVRGNKGPEVVLQPEDVTAAEVLQQAGYRTALFGKWGLGFTGTPGIPNKQGFDEFFGFHTQMQAHTYYPHQLHHNQDDHLIPLNFGVKNRRYAPDLFAERALEFLDKNRGNRFFMYYAMTIPHANNELGRDTGNGMEVPELGEFANKSWPDPEKGFAAMVERMDRDVGRLLDRLRELGLEKNTLVMFSSDNGPHQEGGHQEKFFESSGKLRGIKRDLYEGGIRVPFLAKWPGVTPAGSTSNEVIAFWDIVPTFADIAGVKTPAKVDGISIVPALKGGSLPEDRVLYWEFHEGGFNQAIRFGDWKAIRFGKDGPIELYDLSKDPSETKDLAASHPEMVEQAKQIFARQRTESPDFPVQPGAARSPDRGYRIK
jgi:arylsulfatase A-like enzyme